MRIQGLFVACVSLGILSVAPIASAAPLLTVQVELAPGQSGVVTPENPTVQLEVWVCLPGVNGVHTDDGVAMLNGAMVSSFGGLRGDLSFELADTATTGGWVLKVPAGPSRQAWGLLDANVQVTGGFARGIAACNGTRQDLDGDGDLDVGGNDTSNSWDANGYWITCDPGLAKIGSMGFGVLAYPGEDDRVLLGRATFTVTDPSPTAGESTGINWAFRRCTDFMRDFFVVDGNMFWLFGDSNDLGVGPDALVSAGGDLMITFAPEPVTVFFLALGATSMLLRKRRSPS